MGEGGGCVCVCDGSQHCLINSLTSVCSPVFKVSGFGWTRYNHHSLCSENSSISELWSIRGFFFFFFYKKAWGMLRQSGGHSSKSI